MRTLTGAGRDFFVFTHHARNPLTSIQGCARTLLDRENLSADMIRALTEVIARQADELELLLRNAEAGRSHVRDAG